MPRKRRLRKVVAPPRFKGYRPFGGPPVKGDPVELFYEEYEALKLADYDLLNHEKAAALMGISRPTFARIYKSARKKIAEALVEARQIKAVYGNAWLDKNWFECGSCHARFTFPKNRQENRCPVCGESLISPMKNTM